MSKITIYGHRTETTASFSVGDHRFDGVVLGVSHSSLRYSEEFDPSRHGDALRDHLAALSKKKNRELGKINGRRKALFAGTVVLASMTAAWRLIDGVDALSGFDHISDPAAQISLTVAEGCFVAAACHEIATRSKRKGLQDNLRRYARVSARVNQMQHVDSPFHHRHPDEFYDPAAASNRSLFTEFDDTVVENDGPGATVLQFRPRTNGDHSA